MHFRISSWYTLLLSFVVAFAIAGCSNEPSEQQKRADAVLAQARSSIGRGEVNEGRRQLDEAIKLDKALGRTATIAEELRLLAGVMRSTGRFDSAAMFYDAAIEQFRNVADRASVRRVTLEIAATDRMKGDDRKAYMLYVEALRLARAFNDSEGVQAVEWAMLPTCRALNETDDEQQALTDLQRSTANDAALRARLLCEIGLSRLEAGDRDSAARSFQQASLLADQSKDTLLSLTALLRLAVVLDASGRLRDSFLAFSDAIRRSEKARGTPDLRYELFVRVGNIYLRMKRPGDAIKFYRAAFAVSTGNGNRIQEGYATTQIGCCQMESSRDAAVKTYRSARDLFKSLSYAPGLSYAELCLGIAMQRAALFTEAEKHLRAAADEAETVFADRNADNVYDDCEQSYLGAGKDAALQELFEMLVQGGRYDDAFAVAERRNLKDLRSVVDALAPHPSDEHLASSLQNFLAELGRHVGAERALETALVESRPQKELLATIRNVIDASEQKLAELATTVVERDKAYEPVVRAGTVSLASVQMVLPPGVTFLEYVPTRRSLYVFAVTSGHVSVQMAAVGRDSVESQCSQFLSLLQRREMHVDSTVQEMLRVSRRLNDLTAVLYSTFLRPVESSLGGSSKLVVVFGGSIPTIPLHALRRGTLPGSAFVAERHFVTYLPTAQMLLLNTPSPGSVHDVVGLGYPGGSGWDVEYELRDIRAFYKNTRLYFNQQASLATLQEERADLLHLALEFRLDDPLPGNWYVTLSDGKTPTGSKRVSIGELFSLPAYPVVVVSNLAYDRITIPRSEAYVFIANRTGAYISNLYTPSRKTKKIFGEYLYTALLQGNSVAAAYWKAQLDMMKNPESSEQYSWGPFCFWGK